MNARDGFMLDPLRDDAYPQPRADDDRDRLGMADTLNDVGLIPGQSAMAQQNA